MLLRFQNRLINWNPTYGSWFMEFTYSLFMIRSILEFLFGIFSVKAYLFFWSRKVFFSTLRAENWLYICPEQRQVARIFILCNHLIVTYRLPIWTWFEKLIKFSIFADKVQCYFLLYFETIVAISNKNWNYKRKAFSETVWLVQ